MMPRSPTTILIATARGPMAAARVGRTSQIAPAASDGLTTPPGTDRRLGAILAIPMSPGDRVTTRRQAARIPRWPVRRPMAPPCVIGEQRKDLYVSDANSMGVGFGILDCRRIGLRGRAAAFQRSGTGYAASMAIAKRAVERATGA